MAEPSAPAAPEVSLWQALFNRRMLTCIFTGLASGMPLFLLLQLIPVWLRTEQVSLQDIGLLTLVQLPYTWKFLWAPLLDRYQIPGLARRHGWMFVLQLGLAAAIFVVGLWSPSSQLLAITVCAVLIGLFSASLDVIIDAYRRELLPDAELGLGNSIHVQAYRISGLIPASLGLILAEHLPWSTVFTVMAGFMLLGAVASLLVPRLPDLKPEDRPVTLKAAFVLPFREYLDRRGALGVAAVLAFIVLYKFGDSMATALSSALFVDLGFSPAEIGKIAKNAALWPSIIGALVGGLLMVKIGINRALWLFGAVQLATIFGFVWLSQTYHDPWVLATVLACEYFGVGLGTAAFVAFMARETSPALAATQYALFSAISAVPRILGGATSGFLVSGANADGLSGFSAGLAGLLTSLGLPEAGLGWTNFFYLCAVLAVPGMILLIWVAPFKEPKTGPDSPDL